MTTARQALEYKLRDLERGIRTASNNREQAMHNVAELTNRIAAMQDEYLDITRALETGAIDG